jgi:hypothetical protein
LLLSIATGHDARAQVGYGGYPGGYGGYGFGGWGGGGIGGATAEGDIARGLGAFATGAGIYNQQTAVANSINTDTVIRWNQWVFLSQQEAEKRYIERKHASVIKNNSEYNAVMKRIQESPTKRDIEDGDALNAILDQLTDPRIRGSALRSAGGSVDAKLISQIPFRNASEAITVTLGQLKTATHWPATFQDERFATDKKAYEEAIDRAKQEDEEGDVAPETIAKLRSIVASIKSKLDAAPPTDPTEARQAQNFVKALAGLVRLLEKPDTRQVLNELKNVKTASVANLIGFMHAFNLRFAPATTPSQRLVYAQLFPVLDEARDKIIGTIKPEGSSTAQVDPKHLGDFFAGMKDNEIEGKPAPTAPKPQP